MTVSSWYFGLESVYFDLFYPSKLQKFKIIIKPNLNDTSLHVINAIEFVPDDLITSLKRYSFCKYMICEDAHVSFWNVPGSGDKKWEAYTGLISTPFTNALTQWKGHIKSLCPTSGRFVYCLNGKIVVVDLF